MARPVATTLVAASNASMKAKQAAEYVCDGTADNVQIQAAIAALGTIGGQVGLSEGRFNIAAPIIPANFITLKGMGMGSAPGGIDKAPTELYLVNGVNDYMFKSIAAQAIAAFNVQDLQVNGNRTNQAAGGGFTLYWPRHCNFTRVWITSCFQYGLELGGGGGDVGYQNWLTHCLFGGCATGLKTAFCDENDIDHCLFSYNTIYGASSTSGLDEYDHCTFVGNRNGLYLPDSHDYRIIGNIFDGQTQHALVLSNSGQDKVIGNHFSGTGVGSAPGAWCDIYNWFAGYGNLFVGNTFNSSLADHCIFCDGAAGNYVRARIIGNDFAVFTNSPLSLPAGADIRVSNNGGYINENSGAATAVNDGDPINHGLVAAPTHVEAVASVAGEFVSVTILDVTHFHVAIKKHDGTPGTQQVIYWKARV